MTIFWRGINFLLKAWNLSPRWVVLYRDGETIYSSTFKKRKGEWLLEHSGKSLKEETFCFPRILGTQFAAILPLEKGQVLEWKSPLNDKKKVLKVLPYEMESQFPYPSSEVHFDCVFARKEGDNSVWSVVSVLKDALKEEIEFWKKQGLYLDALEWEGNLQVQSLKEYSQYKEGILSLVVPESKTVHFSLVQDDSILAQKMFLGRSQSQWKKRVQLIQKQFSQKQISEVAPDQLCGSFQFSKSIPKKALLSFFGFVSRLPEGLNARVNLLSQKEKQEWFGFLALKNAPVLSTLCLYVAIAFTASVLIQNIYLTQEISLLKQKEKRAIETISKKLGLSQKEIRTASLSKLIYQKKASVLKAFLETSETLSQTSSATYKGHLLEINAQKFNLEGETQTFSEAEGIQKELSASSVLRNVMLVRSEKVGDKVSFKIQADWTQ